METKISRIIIFSKISYFILSFSFINFFFLVNRNFFLRFCSYFSFSLEEKIYPLFFSLRIDQISFLFITIVCFVTTLVFFYSEVYIETYNNKKFFFITLSFFFSIRVLSSRGSLINLIIGWDGLGISSLLLIMFYPNKISFFNSFLTFFFNRLGDIFFLIFFCYYLMNLNVVFYFSKDFQYVILLIFFLCLLTKRAQYPFSSWLPAAISAPTPISAIVHSSTLVTAGIFIFFKFSIFFDECNILILLLILRVITFILGGFLGVIELDLKKIVAFSTIRQIRIILFFISTNFLSLGLCHTFYHALFKTLLFCGCGFIFL